MAATAFSLIVCLASPVLASDRIGPSSAASSPTLRAAECPVRRSPSATRNGRQHRSSKCGGSVYELTAGPGSLFGHGRSHRVQESGELRYSPGGGDSIRQDFTLQVGGLTESVEVRSSSGLDETRPDVSHTVNEKYYRDLPIITAGDVRLAESVLQMQPGYLPMKPNGDPMFRGSQFQSRINGGQRAATENFFDGAAFGYASGHQQSQESTPPVDSVQEVKVTTTSYSAQYGHTSGGFISTPRRAPMRFTAAATGILRMTHSTRRASSPSARRR